MSYILSHTILLYMYKAGFSLRKYKYLLTYLEKLRLKIFVCEVYRANLTDIFVFSFY